MLCVTISSDDKYIVSGSEDKSIKIFNLESREEVYHFVGAHKGKKSHKPNHILAYVTSVQISSDNKYIVSGSDDKSIKIFDFASKQEIHRFKKVHRGKYYFDTD